MSIEISQRVVFYILLYSSFHWSCADNHINEKTNRPITKTGTLSELHSERVFKTWLRDTLPYLYNWQRQEQENIVNKEITLGKDSLTLETNTFYEASINHNEKLSGQISNVIYLLKDYNELPLNDFKLSFVDYMFYWPSSVEEMKYDYIFELKNIQVLEGDSRIEYTYIRGRLSNKVLFKKGQSGKQEVIKTDFIWKGDSLMKMEQQ
ncbi:MAG: hypothetical protein ABI723_08900 [Bacteroidia bacterium]